MYRWSIISITKQTSQTAPKTLVRQIKNYERPQDTRSLNQKLQTAQRNLFAKSKIANGCGKRVRQIKKYERLWESRSPNQKLQTACKIHKRLRETRSPKRKLKTSRRERFADEKEL